MEKDLKGHLASRLLYHIRPTLKYVVNEEK